MNRTIQTATGIQTTREVHMTKGNQWTTAKWNDISITKVIMSTRDVNQRGILHWSLFADVEQGAKAAKDFEASRRAFDNEDRHRHWKRL